MKCVGVKTYTHTKFFLGTKIAASSPPMAKWNTFFKTALKTKFVLVSEGMTLAIQT